MSVSSISTWLNHPPFEWISALLTSVKLPDSNVWLSLLGLFILYKLLDRLVRIPRIGSYSHRYVLVTGAGRGFGYDAVLRLDAIGCHVFAGVRTAESANEIRAVCSARVYPVILDINSDDIVEAAVKYVTSKLPPGRGLWGVVNNAATLSFHQMEWAQLSDYQEALQTNIMGPVRVTTAFLPLVKQARGRVVNVTSIAGRMSATVFAPYCISKYGLESYSDLLRRTMRPYGVKVLIIEPGTFKTSMLTDAEAGIRKMWDRVPEEKKKELGVKSLNSALWCRNLFETFASKSIGDVSEAYVHALMGRFPRARYAVGLDCTFVYKPLIFLPEWLSDMILSFVM